MSTFTVRDLLGIGAVVATGAAASSVLAACGAVPATRGGGKVVISGWGGAIQEAMRTAYFDPFTKETGISVEEVTFGGDGLAKLKAQLDEGRVQVDILDGPPFWTVVGQTQNLLERIDPKYFDKANLIPGALGDYGFGYATVSWGITYNTQTFGASHPRTWADFWDTARFPGRRAMFGPLVARHLEYALMADGGAPAQVYPLDDARIERAFRKLTELKPSIAVWYQSGSQGEQLLQSKEVVLGEFFNGRTFYLADQGVPVDFEWNQAVMNFTTWVLARNAPNRENAQQLLGFMSRPEPQARFAELIFYGPTNRKALDALKDEKIARRLPTHPDNLAKQVQLDGDWWGANLGKLAQRWNTLVAK